MYKRKKEEGDTEVRVGMEREREREREGGEGVVADRQESSRCSWYDRHG